MAQLTPLADVASGHGGELSTSCLLEEDDADECEAAGDTKMDAGEAINGVGSGAGSGS
jgi:hypothetical protein